VNSIAWKTNATISSRFGSAQDWLWLHNRWKTPTPIFSSPITSAGSITPEIYEDLKPFQFSSALNWLGDSVIGVPARAPIKPADPILTSPSLSEKSLPSGSSCLNR
jgi:hypothetical protein